MGSFDDNIPLTRITPTKPWGRQLPQRNPRGNPPKPGPKPVGKPENEQPAPDTGGCHIDEYA